MVRNDFCAKPMCHNGPATTFVQSLCAAMVRQRLLCKAYVPQRSGNDFLVQSLCALLLDVLHQPHSNMIGGGSDLSFAARPDHVTRAVLIRTQKRPAAMHTLFHARFSGIE